MRFDIDLLGRLAETEYASFDDGKNRVTDFGTFVSHLEFPTRYDPNQLLRCRCGARDIEDLLSTVEERYAPTGLSFRKISGHDALTWDALAAVLPGRGWKA